MRLDESPLDEMTQECLAHKAFIRSKFRELQAVVDGWEPRPYKATDDTSCFWEHQSRVSTVKKREERPGIPGQP